MAERDNFIRAQEAAHSEASEDLVRGDTHDEERPKCFAGVRTPSLDEARNCRQCAVTVECLSEYNHARAAKPKIKFTPTKYDAVAILLMAADHLQDRATKYDQPQGERSMPATVAAFNVITGHSLTEEQGWLFMELLKCVRAEANTYHADNYEDGAAYAALKGEAAARNRKKDT